MTTATGAPSLHWPPLPLDEWQPTKDTLHLYAQMVGKVRLRLHPTLNHWWHTTLYVSPRGLTTHAIPYGGLSVELTLDLIDHLEVVRVVYRGVALMRVADRGVGFVMIVLSRRELGVAVVPRGVRLIVPVTDRRVGVLVVYAS